MLNCVSSRLIGFLCFRQPLSLHSNSFVFGEQPGHYVPTSIQSAPLRPAVVVQRKHALSTETELGSSIMSNDSNIEFFRQAACQLTLGSRQFLESPIDLTCMSLECGRKPQHPGTHKVLTSWQA